jgi:hypothetical protein
LLSVTESFTKYNKQVEGRVNYEQGILELQKKEGIHFFVDDLFFIDWGRKRLATQQASRICCPCGVGRRR